MTMTEGTRRESSYRSRDLSSGTATALLDSPRRTARPSYHRRQRLGAGFSMSRDLNRLFPIGDVASSVPKLIKDECVLSPVFCC